MAGKLPSDAFEVYMGLGPDRSYQAVADHFGVSKRAVTNRATKERWQQRAAEIEAKARQGAEQRLVETLEDMNTRHLKSLRVVQARALEALRAMPLQSAMEAVRALDVSIRQERLIRGEPSERTALQVEEVIKRQYERWMVEAGDAADDGAEGTP
jgi:transposase